MGMFDSPSNEPLAERMRPHRLQDIAGQSHLTASGSPLQKLLQSGKIPSLIFWGPPGVGKTTLAGVIAQETRKEMIALSAINSGVKDIREVLNRAENNPGKILFIDEIHRFNKSQQDSLLGAVEKGVITLIGATTENPSFEVNAALLSRCQIFKLNSLSREEMDLLLNRAIETDAWLRSKNLQLADEGALFELSGGDARKALNLLEMAALQLSDSEPILTAEYIQQAASEKRPLYDKQGEYHYDVISAFIKSVRGSDPNAAVYWLALMLEAGEDIKFIARRLLILASEDIGNANPNALLLATSGFQAVERLGMPEARIILSQVTTYLACSPKSNAAYLAIDEALALVRNKPQASVPMHLRNAPTRLMKESGYGEGYKYSHNYAGNEGNQLYLPEEFAQEVFYRPKDISREKEMRAFLKSKWPEKYPD
jgi:putative ATPase